MRVEVKDYVKTIGKATVLDHVSYTFKSGKIYGLRGKNGSGKTMLMRAICGLINPMEGCVCIDGKIIGKDISFPESAGVLIENPGFISGYTAFQNLKTIASIQNRISDEEIKAVILAVGLDPEDTRKYRKFSLGMKQRLGIASAVMENPALILLDEPTNALDESGVVMVRELLEKQKKNGAVIIVASHDKEELELLTDEILIIENGKIKEHFDVRRVLHLYDQYPVSGSTACGVWPWRYGGSKWFFLKSGRTYDFIRRRNESTVRCGKFILCRNRLRMVFISYLHI